MKVFISWSKTKSHAMAKLLKEWIPQVIQATDPWISSEDIQSGTQWWNEIAKELEAAKHGIVCLSAANIQSPWIFFESGALSKGMENNRLWTILIDIEEKNVTGPLQQFNHTKLEKASILKLVKSINNCLEISNLTQSQLLDSFEMWWPKLEVGIEKVKNLKEKEPVEKVERNEEDVMDEILYGVRDMQKRISSLETATSNSKDRTKATILDTFKDKFSFEGNNKMMQYEDLMDYQELGLYENGKFKISGKSELDNLLSKGAISERQYFFLVKRMPRVLINDTRTKS